jgi:hypothetical protein
VSGRTAKPFLTRQKVPNLLNLILGKVVNEGAMSDDLTKEGTVMATVGHSHPDWDTNNNSYNWALPGHGLITWGATKNSEKTLSVWIEGPFRAKYDFTVAMPPCPGGQLTIGVTWVKGEVILYLNGKRAKALSSPRTPL